MATSADANRASETPIELMYRVGVKTVPAIAEEVSSIASSLEGLIQEFDVQSALAGEPRAMRHSLEVCGDVHEALRRAVISLNNSAGALVATADDFRETDERAARDYQRLDGELRGAEPTEAYEGERVDSPEKPGAITPGHAPTRGKEEHLEPTPDPELPTSAGERRRRDERIDPVGLPEEIDR